MNNRPALEPNISGQPKTFPSSCSSAIDAPLGINRKIKSWIEGVYVLRKIGDVMTSIINKSFTTLIAFLLFSGCLSLPQNEDSESKLECEEKIILSHEDLVERDSEKIVVANVRHFDNAANLRCLDFHRASHWEYIDDRLAL